MIELPDIPEKFYGETFPYNRKIRVTSGRPGHDGEIERARETFGNRILQARKIIVLSSISYIVIEGSDKEWNTVLFENVK